LPLRPPNHLPWSNAGDSGRLALEGRPSAHSIFAGYRNRMDHAFVVMAFGQSPFVEGCLRDLSRQTLRSRIVLSTSTPSETLEHLARAYDAEYAISEPGRGIGADWNFALRASGARFVTLVHQDDTYRPEFLEASLGLLKRYDAALSFTGYDEVDDAGRKTSSKISRVKHAMDAAILGNIKNPTSWRMRLYLAFGVALPCSSVTYDLEKLGDFEFSTAYKANLDWDAWLRLVEAGKRFVREPSRLVGRRHNELTATSRAHASGARRREDEEMFHRIWPAPLARLVATAYRAGY
jgi:hypothetical protein